jgi:dienelactone hydrolase
VQELPAYIPSNGEDMFAILTLPDPDVPDQHTGVTLALGNFMASFARNRMYRRAAAVLAAQGYHVMRTDYRGNGDHSFEIPNIDDHEEFAPDFREMARFFLEHTTIDRVVMVGSCFASRAVIDTFDDIPGLDGIVAVSPPLINADPVVGGGLRNRVNNKFMQVVGRRLKPLHEVACVNIRRLIDNGPPLLIIYGERDQYYKQEFLRSGFDTYQSPEGRRLDLVLYPGQVHDYPSISLQDTIIQKLVEWIPARHGALAQAGAAQIAQSWP